MPASVPRLLLVTNRGRAAMSLPELARAALAGGADVVQVREKDLDQEALRRLLTHVLGAAADPSRVVVNGDAKLAREFGVGLHLPEAAATERPEGIQLLSRAVHSIEGAAALRGADFAVVGHVYDTASKPRRPPIGIDGLGAIVAASPVPVVAIGGITPDRVAEVFAAGASGIAVMSGINDADDPEAAARAFREAIERNT